TIRRLLDHLVAALQGIVAQPRQRVSDVTILTRRERNQLLRGGQTGRSRQAEHAPVHDHVDAQAVRTPDAVAVVHGGAHVTYAVLAERASRLARRLQHLGVGTDSRVAVCLEHGPEVLAALVGVLKAGGAYVPLDPLTPANRLASIVALAGARVFI